MASFASTYADITKEKTVSGVLWVILLFMFFKQSANSYFIILSLSVLTKFLNIIKIRNARNDKDTDIKILCSFLLCLNC